MPTPTPVANINSLINLGLADSVPELYEKPTEKSLYLLIVQTAQNILTNIEAYCGITQKPMTQWANLAASATLRRQNLGRLYISATEVITYGGFVNLHNNAGILSARNANSSTGRRTHGYCNVRNSQQTGMAIGQFGEIILSQGLIPIAGVVIGTEYFLSPVNGQIQVGPDVTAGHIEQYIGIGVDTNLLYVDITTGSYIQH